MFTISFKLSINQEPIQTITIERQTGMDCFCTWRSPNLLFAFATWSSGVQEAWRIFMISSETPRLRTSQQRKQRRGCTSLFCFRYLVPWTSGGLEDFYDLLRNSTIPNLPAAKVKTGLHFSFLLSLLGTLDFRRLGGFL